MRFESIRLPERQRRHKHRSHFPLITIGITCFNAADTIARAIESAVKQDWPNTEIIIIDDASTDASAEVLKEIMTKHPELRVIRQPANQGYPAALNTIVKVAKGEFLAIFDDDDESCADRLTEQWYRLTDYERRHGTKLILCYSNRAVVAAGQSKPHFVGKAIGREAPEPSGPMVADYLFGHLADTHHVWGKLGSGTLMARRETFQAVGDFDVSFRRCAEWDFAIRAGFLNAHFVSVNKPLVTVYRTPTADKAGKIPLHYQIKIRQKYRKYLLAQKVYLSSLAWVHTKFHANRRHHLRKRLYQVLAYGLLPLPLCYAKIAARLSPATPPPLKLCVDTSRSEPAIPSVALFIHRLAGRGGGGQRMVCELANALSRRGFAVHMVTLDGPEGRAAYELDSRVVWSRLGFQSGSADKLRRTWALARLLRDNGVGALIGFVIAPEKTVFAAAKLAGVPLIAAERNAPTMYHLHYGFVHRWLSFGMLHLADRITVQHPDYVTGYPASLQNRMDVIANPVSLAKVRAQPDQPGTHGRFNLLAVGRLNRAQKRYDCLVRAFARIANDHPDWDLRIVGDGSERDALLELAAFGGVAERVRLESWTPDISNVYANSHLLAVPSRWEGFSNSQAEAMSHGLPAIGFRDAAGVVQLIADGETGWLVPGLDDDAALASVLSAAMADGTERARRGACAAQSMTAYPPEFQFDSWVRLLNSLMGTSDQFAARQENRILESWRRFANNSWRRFESGAPMSRFVSTPPQPRSNVGEQEAA